MHTAPLIVTVAIGCAFVGQVIYISRNSSARKTALFPLLLLVWLIAGTALMDKYAPADSSWKQWRKEQAESLKHHD